MIKNTYVKCALVLGAICVSSAVLIGGLNTVANIYKETHKSDKAPTQIQDLKPAGTFVEVTENLPQAVTMNSTKITFTSVWALMENGTPVGYAYEINCGKPVKTEVTFTVLFEGPAIAELPELVQPSAINVTVGGDSGYDSNVVKLADGLVAGTSTANDYSSVMSGGTKSQKFFIDGVQAARKDYASRINGQTDTVVQKTPLQDIYGDLYKAEAEDTSFTKLEATTDHCSYEITNRYLVTLTNNTTTVAYAGTVSFQDPEGETDVLKLTAAFSGDKSTVKLDGYKVTKDISWNDYKSWMDGVKAGTTSLEDENAVHTGSTLSTNAVRDMILGMRDAYVANYKSEVEKLFGDKYVSESADEFAAVTGTTDHCSYEITKRTSVVLTDGTGKAYEATVSFQDPEGETDVLKLMAAFSGDEGNAKLEGYKITKDISWNDYKKWMDGVKAGTTSMDDENAVKTGSTLSTNAVRDLLLAMRTNYYATFGE